jgi:hypothetical protein
MPSKHQNIAAKLNSVSEQLSPKIIPCSEMLRRVAIVRTDVKKERIASVVRVTGIGELGTTLAVTSNRNQL